ncbi:orotidine 5'-phosphate decarboxylase / HUMPS family protein [Calditrichota bacterium GD2]
MVNVRKLIPALDTDDLKLIEHLVREIDRHELIYGYKLGFIAGLRHGLPRVVETIRRFSAKPIIYDHQKAATDIPDMGKRFAQVMKHSGVDEVILFPQAGPATLEAWVKALKEEELKVIVGGIMTHARYRVSEGGYLDDRAVLDIYSRSASLGVRRFVVPLTKPDAVREVIQQLPDAGQAEFYSPGFGKQGGDPAQFGFLRTHYLIVGRALLGARDPLGYLEGVQKELKV